MSNKFCGVMVTFNNDLSEEYVDTICKLIESIKGVATAKPKMTDIDHHFAYERAKAECAMKLLALSSEWMGMK